MRIIVTGAGGFVGRHVLAQLTEHEIVALDKSLQHIPDASYITKVEGDLQDADVLESAFSHGCDAVIHLATVPGGAAETHPALAKSVNVDATMALIDMAAKAGNCPPFVFASSIAVFGKLPLTPVIDTTLTRPTMLYGAHKLMMENWLECQTQRGAVKGLSLRLPGIVARPKSPSGMKSAFLSDIFHALRDGDDFTMPVSQDATSWLCSVQTAAKNMSIAAIMDRKLQNQGAPILIPALRVNMRELEQEIRRQVKPSTSVITYSQEARLQSIFGEHPMVTTPKALNMGFVADTNLRDLVKSVL